MQRKSKSLLWDFPCPGNLNLIWTFGSLRGLCLVIQIVRGLVLALYYQPDVWNGHYNVKQVAEEAWGGWVFRGYHILGATFFFICVYLHIARTFYYGGYEKAKVWMRGLIILILLMAIAFLGYVLPWGQISYWGCTVITNLFSTIPNVGKEIVEWLWGGGSVNDHTLKRFYMLHILLPFGLALISTVHLHFLHQVGSRNPIGCLNETADQPFYPKYYYKDLYAAGTMFTILRLGALFCPYANSVPENWMEANPMLTPEHIEPEWYFLWLYSILRSIETKTGGVVAIFGALLCLFFLPLAPYLQEHKGLIAYPLRRIFFVIWALNFLYITYLGRQAIEGPLLESAPIHVYVYYRYLASHGFINWFTDKNEFFKAQKYRDKKGLGKRFPNLRRKFKRD